MPISGILSGQTIAILVAEGFEQVEMTEPQMALELAGARTFIISPHEVEVRGWKFKDWGDTFPVDAPLRGVRVDEYDGLLLPGGVMNPDSLRMIPEAVNFAKEFFRARKPVAAICHGPWLLAEAGVVKGRKVTSWPSIRTDLINAGAQWVDQEVVVDDLLVTSRKPDDLPAFNRKMLEVFQGARMAAAGAASGPGTS